MIYMPHPGHFICARDCKFFLNTWVNGYIISTVGEYFPQANTREVIAQCRGIALEGRGDDRERDYMKKIGYEKIGYDYLYETMVFKAKVSESPCCPYKAVDYTSIDFKSYNDAGDAYAGHKAMIEKWEFAIFKGDININEI